MDLIVGNTYKFMSRKFYTEAPKELQEELIRQADAGVKVSIKVATRIVGEMVEAGAGQEVEKFFKKYNTILVAQEKKKNEGKGTEPTQEEQTEQQEQSNQSTEDVGVEMPTESGRVVAYLRLSQQESLEKNGFSRQLDMVSTFKPVEIYQDVISGSIRNRPELDRMINELQVGDVVIIPAIDRLSRSLLDLLDIVEVIKEKGAMLKSVNEPWLDTTSSNPMSSFLLTIMGAFSQLERDMIAERIKRGCEVARKNGVKFGRPLKNGANVEHAISLYRNREMSTRQIEKVTGVSRSTLMRRVKELKEKGEL